nr:MAG TPA: hypothetical protein [Caudoviricetes sp.]
MKKVMLVRVIYLVAITLLFSYLLSKLQLFPYNTITVFLYLIVIILAIKFLFSVEISFFNLILWHFSERNEAKSKVLSELRMQEMPYIKSYYVHDIKSYLEYIIDRESPIKRYRELFPLESKSAAEVEYLFEHTDYFEEKNEKFPQKVVVSASRMLGRLEGIYMTTPEPLRSAQADTWDEALREFYGTHPDRR